MRRVRPIFSLAVVERRFMMRHFYDAPFYFAGRMRARSTSAKPVTKLGPSHCAHD
jgi:hypothetical protein